MNEYKKKPSIKITKTIKIEKDLIEQFDKIRRNNFTFTNFVRRSMQVFIENENKKKTKSKDKFKTKKK